MTDAERNEVWNEAMDRAAREAESPRDGNERIAARIRDLKRYPLEVLCEHGAGEGKKCCLCFPCLKCFGASCPPREMASVDNGLLPAPRK